MSVPVIKGDFEVPHTRDVVLAGDGALEGTRLRGIGDSVSESGKAGSVGWNGKRRVASQVESLEFVDHQ